MKVAKPRKSSFYGMGISGTIFPDGTWLEDEEFAYPNGGFTRRVRATCDDGVQRVFRCSIPDTYFSIPARGKISGKSIKGCVTASEAGMKFIPYENQN